MAKVGRMSKWEIFKSKVLLSRLKELHTVFNMLHYSLICMLSIFFEDNVV